MEDVDVGVMLPGAVPFNDLNINPVLKAHIKTNSGVTAAFVKQLSLRKLYIECATAVIGRNLGLTIPKPIIVRVTSDDFENIPEGKYDLAFGSEDADYPSFRRYGDCQEALEKLYLNSETLKIAVFDEWIGNWDRNLGNILYDGGDSFLFIDHENAIAPELDYNSPARKNELVKGLYGHLSEFEKFQIKKQASDNVMPEYKNITLSILASKTHALSYLDDAEVLSVIKFLESRISVLNKLFSDRLNLKQQEMTYVQRT